MLRRCSTAVTLALAAVLLCAPGAHGTPIGCLKLDNYTFEKVLNLPTKPHGMKTLVKFDQEGASGDAQEAYKILCKASQRVMHFFVAEVNVEESGGMYNDELRERFKLTKADYPAYFFFSKEDKWGTRYNGTVTAAGLAEFLRDRGVKINVPIEGGRKRGRRMVPEFEELAHDLLHATEVQKRHILTRAKRLERKQGKDDLMAEHWVFVMEAIVAEGFTDTGAAFDRWLHSQTHRLETTVPDMREPEKSRMTNRMVVFRHIEHFKHKMKDEL